MSCPSRLRSTGRQRPGPIQACPALHSALSTDPPRARAGLNVTFHAGIDLNEDLAPIQAGLCSHSMRNTELHMCITVPSTSGNDLNEDLTPIEAGLTWTVGKRRREAFDFLGGEVGDWIGLVRE